MRAKYVAPILGWLVVFQVALRAQEARGTIAGRVIDPSDAVIGGAEVRVTHAATGASVSSRTNETGNYTIPYLLSGTYRLSVEMAGFKKAERPGIEVRVNDILNVDVQLHVVGPSETVEVVATGTPLLESSTVSVGQVVDGRRLADLPIQAGNAFELVMLAPGVVNTTNMRPRKAGFGNAASQFRTNGNRLYSNEFTLDGVPNTFASGDSPQVAFQPPRAAVAEFRVQTNAFDASLGHTAGAVVNLVTKSGGNQFHGELHEWVANSALDAASFFQNRAGEKKPVYQDHQYGASLSGPLLVPKVYSGRNRTFFFYAWEANQWGKPITKTGTVPTAAEQNGDLSGLLALESSYQLYDPLTTRAADRGRYSRQPLAGNLVPASRIDPVAQALMRYYPAANAAGTRDGRNNYVSSVKDTMDYYVHFGRLDHNFSERNRTYLRLHYDNYAETKENYYRNIALGLNVARINRGGVLDHVLTLGPAAVLNVRYGLSYTEAPKARRSRGFDLASLGFSPALVSLVDPNVASFPNVYLNTKRANAACKSMCTGTFSGLGAFEKGEGYGTGLIHNLAATLSALRRNHNLRMGVDLRAYRAAFLPLGYDVAPGLQFLPTYTKGPLDNSPSASMGQEFAAFLLGIPEGQMDRSASYATQDLFIGFFIQDDWKLTRRLTLNVGLRYEYETPITERFNRAIRGFDGVATNPIEAEARANYARNQIPELPWDSFRVRGGLTFAGPDARGLWKGEKNNLLPRIGLAFQMNDKTVIRTGYGFFFDTLGVNRTAPLQPGFTASTPIIPSYDNGLSFVATTANPLPSGLMVPRGAADGLATNLGQDLTVYSTTRLQPYSQQWTFGLQRLLPGGFVLETAYAGNKGIRLGVGSAVNRSTSLSRSQERDEAFINYMSQQIPSPFYGLSSVYTKTMSRADLLKPYPQYGSIDEDQPIGYSWHHAMQARLEKRFSKGYTLNAAYTFSKSREATSFLNSVDPMVYRSISRYDRPHRLVVSGILELPFGRGRALASGLPKTLDHFLGGWQLNTVVTKQSGPPLAFGDVIFRGNIKGIPLPKSQRSVDRWFITDGFEKRTSKQLEYSVRTFPRYLGGVRADGHSKWDFSLLKAFRLREKVRLEFRAECYNAVNHPSFETPDMDVTSSTFGMVSDQGGLPRQFQLALKLTF
jgi:hypothetical protein